MQPYFLQNSSWKGCLANSSSLKSSLQLKKLPSSAWIFFFPKLWFWTFRSPNKVVSHGVASSVSCFSGIIPSCLMSLSWELLFHVFHLVFNWFFKHEVLFGPCPFILARNRNILRYTTKLKSSIESTYKYVMYAVYIGIHVKKKAKKINKKYLWYLCSSIETIDFSFILFFKVFYKDH
jgi:hypothetical protein